MSRVVLHFAQYNVASARPERRRRAQSRCGPRVHTSLNDFSIFEEETIKSVSNRKAIGPDELLAELLKLIFDEHRYGDRHILEQFHAIVAIWHRAGLYRRRSGKMP